MSANNPNQNSIPCDSSKEHYLQEETDLNTKCGCFSWYPEWLQKLGNLNSFMIFYGLMGLLTIGMGTYGNSTLTSVEKRFKIPSTTSGIIGTLWDIGNIGMVLITAYFGGRGNKPLWMGIGVLISSFYCWIRLLPHLIYGPGEDVLRHTIEYRSSLIDVGLFNESDAEIMCNSSGDPEICTDGGNASIVACILLGLGNFVAGMSLTIQYTLGITYIDDNCKKNDAPILISITNIVRMFGPTLGYVVGSYVLNIFVDPTLTPTIKPEDPRWIGAWWLGYCPFGIATIIFGIIMFTFPKEFPKAKQRRLALESKLNTKKEETKLSFSDFKLSMTCLLKNKLLMLISFSTVFYVLGLIGYWYFLPKYIETQFNQSASAANLFTGSVGLIFSAIGVIASGIYISKYKPLPEHISAWNLFTEILDALGHVAYAFIGCPNENLFGSWDTNNNWNMTAECNNQCDCGPMVKYSPVCWLEGDTTFYSACHAGCTEFSFINETKTFSNCSCVEDFGSVTDGPCPVDCSSSLIMFLVVQGILQLLSSSGTAGNLIVQFRCVREEDKALSIGMIDMLASLLAFVPGPIIFGAILDSTCMVWGYECGETGNCWLYEGRKLRLLLNLTAFGFLVIAILLDIGVTIHSKGLKIYDEDVEKEIEDKGISKEDKIFEMTKL